LKIIIETGFSEPLFKILTTIAKDKKSASKKFNKVEENEIKVLDIFKWQDR